MEKIVEQALLYDFYGELLTEHQRNIYEGVVFNDMSISEIAEEQGISRQGVHDNLSRTEALLRNMEAKTGCAGRDQACRKAAKTILDAAQKLQSSEGASVSALAQTIVEAAKALEE
jgi:predicted DNA-binding protein YlxM (UPF0122 family)